MDPIISTRASHLIIHRLEFHLSQLGVSVGLLHEFVAFTKRVLARVAEDDFQQHRNIVVFQIFIQGGRRVLTLQRQSK